MSLRILKIVTIVAPALFVGLLELLRHVIFVEHPPMMIGNVIVFVTILVGTFLFSRLIFGVITKMQKEMARRNQELATLEERERIAREMHDGLAQVLSYVNIKTQAARQFLAVGQEAQTKDCLEELEETAQNIYADVRETILGLRTSVSPQKDMMSTLKEYLFRFSQMSNIRTELQVRDGSPPFLLATTELQVIRIIQEALTNVRKHAQASHAWVRVSSHGKQVEIVIEDNGQGFDTSHIRRRDGPQFGLQTMKERTESVGGTLEITSASGQGTKVTIKVPLAQEAKE